MPIRSHRIPIAYLKRFAVPGKRGHSKLCVYQRGKPPRVGTPKGEVAEKGFLRARTESGAIDDAPFEAWTQTIEDGALECLLHADKSTFVWSMRLRQSMADYWALLFSRAAATFEFHKEYWDKRLTSAYHKIETDAAHRQRLASKYSSVSGRSLTEQDILRLFSSIIPNMKSEAEMRNAYVQRLKARTKLLSDILLKKPWQVWIAPANCEFVTSDSPVITMRIDPDGRFYLGYGFARDGVVAIMPISHGACLVAGVAGPELRSVTLQDVSETNKGLICCSLRFVYSRTRDADTDWQVQRAAGSIRMGANAFVRDAEGDDLEEFN